MGNKLAISNSFLGGDASAGWINVCSRNALSIAFDFQSSNSKTCFTVPNSRASFCSTIVHLLLALVLLSISSNACKCSSAEQGGVISQDGRGITFVLDPSNQVWAFASPINLEHPFKFRALSNIRNLYPFVATRNDGTVLEWGLGPASVWASELELNAVYTSPQPAEVPSWPAAIAANYRFLLAAQGSSLGVWKRSDAGIDQRRSPYFISFQKNIKSLALSGMDAGVLLSDGAIFRLSFNKQGNEITRLRKEIASDPYAKTIYISRGNVVALEQDGKLRVWGGCFSASGELQEYLRGALLREHVRKVSVPDDDDIFAIAALETDGRVELLNLSASGTAAPGICRSRMFASDTFTLDIPKDDTPSDISTFDDPTGVESVTVLCGAKLLLYRGKPGLPGWSLKEIKLGSD